MPIRANELVSGFTEVKSTHAAAESTLVASAASTAEARVDAHFQDFLQRARDAAGNATLLPTPFAAFKYDGADAGLKAASGKAAPIEVLTEHDLAEKSTARFFLRGLNHDTQRSWSLDGSPPKDMPEQFQKVLDGIREKLSPDFEVAGWKVTAGYQWHGSYQPATLTAIVRCPAFERQFGVGAA